MYAKKCISVCIFHNLLNWPCFYIFLSLVASNDMRSYFLTSGDIHMHIIVPRYQYNWFRKTLIKLGNFVILSEHFHIDHCQRKWTRQIFLLNYWYDPFEYQSQKSPHWLFIFGQDLWMKLFNVFFCQSWSSKKSLGCDFCHGYSYGSYEYTCQKTYPWHFMLGIEMIKWKSYSNLIQLLILAK